MDFLSISYLCFPPLLLPVHFKNHVFFYKIHRIGGRTTKKKLIDKGRNAINLGIVILIGLPLLEAISSGT